MIKKIQEIYNRNIRDIVNFERCLKKKKKKEKKKEEKEEKEEGKKMCVYRAYGLSPRLKTAQKANFSRVLPIFLVLGVNFFCAPPAHEENFGSPPPGGSDLAPPPLPVGLLMPP